MGEEEDYMNARHEALRLLQKTRTTGRCWFTRDEIVRLATQDCIPLGEFLACLGTTMGELDLFYLSHVEHCARGCLSYLRREQQNDKKILDCRQRFIQLQTLIESGGFPLSHIDSAQAEIDMWKNTFFPNRDLPDSRPLDQDTGNGSTIGAVGAEALDSVCESEQVSDENTPSSEAARAEQLHNIMYFGTLWVDFFRSVIISLFAVQINFKHQYA